MADAVQQMTDQLQRAYSKAGEEMAKQMAAAVVAVVQGAATGHGLPCCMAWPAPAAPEGLTKLVPQAHMAKASWVFIIPEGQTEIPFIIGEAVWMTDLTSGHRLMVV